MGLLSAAMLAEVSKAGAGQLSLGLTITYPDGTEGRYSQVGVASAARGGFSPQVLSFGLTSRGINLRESRLPAVEKEIVLRDDLARTFGKLVDKYRRTLKGSAAEVRWMSPNVADADSFVEFAGVLDGYTMQRPGEWLIRLRTNDRALDKGEVPRSRITAADYPNLDDSAEDVVIPEVFGTHSSENLTDDGALPTWYVDTVRFRYLVAHGWLSVPRVYVDDTLADGADYSIVWETIGGIAVTLIEFTSDQGTTAVVTCDAEGLTANGDGSGALVEDPASVMQLFLRVLGFYEWRQGDYPSLASLPIDTASFSALATLLSTAKAAKWIGDSAERVQGLIEEWAESWEVKVFWTNAGKLGAMLLDHTPPSAANLYSAPLIHVDAIDDRSFSLLFEGGTQVRDISVDYLYVAADGEYAKKLRVRDLTVTEPVSDSREIAWSGSEV